MTSVKLTTFNIEIFRIVQKYIHLTRTKFHTFSLPEERILKIIIKGLLIDITESQITKELTDQSFDVLHIRQFSNSNRQFPIHQVTLKNHPTNKLIYNLDNLFYMSIKIESYRSTNPAQCFACQWFGHSSLHCGYLPRCVKFSGLHLANDCKKTLEKKTLLRKLQRRPYCQFQTLPHFSPDKSVQNTPDPQTTSFTHRKTIRYTSQRNPFYHYPLHANNCRKR